MNEMSILGIIRDNSDGNISRRNILKSSEWEEFTKEFLTFFGEDPLGRATLEEIAMLRNATRPHVASNGCPAPVAEQTTLNFDEIICSGNEHDGS